MHAHHQQFKQYIELCLSKNKQVDFEDYLKNNKTYVATHATNDEAEFQRWFSWFSKSALALKVQAVSQDKPLIINVDCLFFLDLEKRKCQTNLDQNCASI